MAAEQPNCIFCKISAGEIPCEKLFEDRDVLAFLDINPIHYGHALVIPKKHSENLLEMDDETLNKTMVVLKKVAAAVEKATNSHGLNIGINVRPAAGQVVMHSHFHIIPRYSDDGLRPWQRKVSDNKLQEYGEKIRNLL